jgi:hypothetical protein
MGAHVPLVSIVANLSGTHRLHDEPFTWGMGAEFSWEQILFLRGGFTEVPGDDSNLDSSAVGVGIGMPRESFRFRFDYSHTSISSQPNVYGLSLLWQL